MSPTRLGDDRETTVAGADYAYEADARCNPADPIVRAWLTLKPYPEGINNADPGSLQKLVTTTDAPGTGQVTDDGSASDGAATIRFDITAANNTLLGGRDYIFDVKCKTASGAEFPAARGLWTVMGATTLST